MQAEIAKREEQPVAVVAENTASVLALISVLARDETVKPDKIEKLLELQERVLAREAEREFCAAFARVQMKMPHVHKNGTIDLGKGKPIPFSKWEDVDRVIRPILSNEGLVLSFIGESVPTGVHLTAVLSHINGHTPQPGQPGRSTMLLPPDTGPGRNALQALGSSRKYGKRYLAFDVLNIVDESCPDNDGNTAYPLNAEQLNNITGMLDACELSRDGMKKFLTLAQATSVELIQQSRYEELMEALRKKLRKRQEAV